MSLDGAKRLIGVLACAIVLAWPAATRAADLEPPLPPKAAPINASPLAAPSATCTEWSDGCRICQRKPDGEIACSNVGIACVSGASRCTRQ